MPENKRLSKVKAGEIILKQGDKGGFAYMIEVGEVDISIALPSGAHQHVGRRGTGAMIGEMALIDDSPRTATVSALTDCTLVEISREDFSRRLSNSDPIVQMAMQVIATRYRDMVTRVKGIDDIGSMTLPDIVSREQQHPHENIVQTIRIENELKEALKNRDLKLNYQPIVDFKTGDVIGFEALMRWNHKERGFISPAIFIPIAEESGLIVDINHWALEEACAALKRIMHSTGHSYIMSVNFSSEEFAEDDFVPKLEETIRKSGVQPRHVQIEITERLFMANPEKTREQLEACQRLGCLIAIDDFGTGYSSLSYLHYFPIDVLKIDQAFIRNLLQAGNRKMELIKGVINLGKSMGMKVVAEGVETEDEAKTLTGMGCDCAQGYFYAKPLPEPDTLKNLHEWQPKIMKTA